MRLGTTLLILAIMLTVFSFSPVMSQTFTTVTNVSTGTNILSTNFFSTNLVGVTTISLTRSILGTASMGHTFPYKLPGECSGARAAYCLLVCFAIYNITIGAGVSEVSGIVGPATGSDAYAPNGPTFNPQNVPFNFYVLNKEQFNNFVLNDKSYGQYDCGLLFTFGIVHEHVSTNYSLDWKNPMPGSYYLIFQRSQWLAGSYQYTTTADGHTSSMMNSVYFNSVTIPFSIFVGYSSGITSTIYTTTANLVMLTTTQIVTSSQVTTVSSVMNLFTPPLIVGATFVIIATAGALFYLKRKNLTP